MPNYCVFANQPIPIKKRTSFSKSFLCPFVYIHSLLCLSSGSSLAVRETPPDLWIDWLANASLVVPREIKNTLRRSEWPVMSRRDDTSTSSLFSCIFPIAFVLQASHHQYIESPMDWTEIFPLQDCTLCMYICTYNTKDTLPWKGVTKSFYDTLFIHFSDFAFSFCLSCKHF